MNAFKDAGHLFRLAAVFVVGGLAFVGVRALLVPKSFGEYGHYRGDALAENVGQEALAVPGIIHASGPPTWRS